MNLAELAKQQSYPSLVRAQIRTDAEARLNYVHYVTRK